MNVPMIDFKGYRLSVDDVILALKDIAEQKYASIFENPFFAVYKRVYDAYGTKVHMNIYYQTVDESFNLSMFPDKYKREFQENGRWLKFTFHSLKDKPDSPYKYASYEQVTEDFLKVKKERKPI